MDVVLAVEPDSEAIAGLQASLGREGFAVVAAPTGGEGLARLSESAPRLVILEMRLPDADGLDVCREIRARVSLPVIIVCNSTSEDDAVAAFGAGADDFLAKPYRWRELAARVRAALRRYPGVPSPTDEALLRSGDVVVDASRHEVRVRDTTVALPLREFELLELLVANAGKVLTRDALMRQVWGQRLASGTKSVDVHVKRLRAKIEDDPTKPRRIVTVRGVGYKYVVS